MGLQSAVCTAWRWTALPLSFKGLWKIPVWSWRSKLWQKSWRHLATSVKVLLNVADGQHNYVRSVCVRAGRCVGATHGVAPCEGLGISIPLGFGGSAGFPVHSPSICCCTQRTGSSLGWHRISLCFPFSASSCLLPKHRSLRHIISAAVVSTIQHTSRPAAASGWWPMQNTSRGVTHIGSPSYCLHCGVGH